ncbi:hypothetical protein FOCG_10258 [Fusarium oxysporum f. sp. radicis-lycopersici 26381]|uniref:RRM domain-containing protein n=1 Tax=Fusarium oxysporum Fo47 TaxID=660027 RepID=W9LE16_FUSOX|nr:hypothetical protein FOZG_01463 [Fusarium oxysporum Fo47]EWZ91187.1 hypothetical protein FOWG_06867 [Fusarium oxysporum f. sp. lycopersici MN25]EXL50224.1 hypothetical protein FOCG_10258 [Fusarium oxysporum f. sp. radicis-lycopersici 26381]
MTEPEAELQATANLSPVSPSPVHSAASLAVPVLQETVETIDAMVAAAAAAAADANGSINKAPNLEPISGAGGDDDIVDDDSLNDPYGEDDTDVAAQQVPQPQVEQELPDSNDDYAKTFDSPIGTEEGEDGVVEPQDVSSLPRESNEISLSSDHLTNRTSQVSHVVHESSLSAQPGQSATSTTSNASSEAQAAGVANTFTSQPSNQQTSSPSTAKPGASNAASSASPSADIQRLVADLTAPSNPNTHYAPSVLDSEYERQWNQFLADENQYIAEAKWDRFPEGSRIFIGNLSSDKVSKQDVFDLFHRFGRIAQISLKSAYGFVQYHSIEEGQRAMDNLQGIEIKGRRIHLEVSRAQDKSKKDKTRSPDRNKTRDSGRRNERQGHQTRDDYRSSRGHSPHRNDYGRDESYGRDRGFYDNSRGRARSRSPGYGRNGKDNNYRRRSPSPYGRPRHEAELDLPRRYGADVPDVQVILQPDVNRDFVNWVEQAFKSQGLRSEVMFLHPRIPKDMVVQRQAAEGVHAVVDLDIRAQSSGKIPVQAFDRSAGSNNVRYDQYENLDPATAAKVILQAKASGGPPNYGQTYRGNGYGSAPYGGHPPYQAPAASYPGPPPPAQYGQQQPPPVNVTDIANMMGQLDPASLQQLLAQVQGGVQNPTPAQGGTSAAAAGAPQPDIQALLGSLGGNGAAQQHQQQQHPPGPYGASYGHVPQPPSNGDAAVQVQNIMAQLARYRQ